MLYIDSQMESRRNAGLSQKPSALVKQSLG
jgi:hypothetical protein